MQKKRYSEEQIMRVLEEEQVGAKVMDLCCKYGMSNATFYNWKLKYTGMTVNDLRRLKALKKENRKLKHIVADQALDTQALKEINSKNW